MLIPSPLAVARRADPSLSRRVNAKSQLTAADMRLAVKLIKKGEC